MRILFAFLLLITSIACAEQKVVLITGASGGIGFATVKEFQSRDWKVWAGYRNGYPKIYLENVRFIKLDVTSQKDREDAIQTILAEDGKIDALVNNAAVAIFGSEECVSMEEVQKLFDVNFFGALHLIQAVAPTMREKKSGHIINISSTSGIRAIPGVGIYAASKFALEGLSESLAVTLSPWNIRVSLVEPGSVNNDMMDHTPLGTRFVDEPVYQKLAQGLHRRFSALAPSGQSCEEIAALIADVAENPEPDMRYQTSAKVKETAAKKFVDLSGNALRGEQMRFMQSLVQD